MLTHALPQPLYEVAEAISKLKFSNFSTTHSRKLENFTMGSDREVSVRAFNDFYIPEVSFSLRSDSLLNPLIPSECKLAHIAVTWLLFDKFL